MRASVMLGVNDARPAVNRQDCMQPAEALGQVLIIPEVLAGAK